MSNMVALRKGLEIFEKVTSAPRSEYVAAEHDII